jgi:hypothetical protein
MGCCNRLRISDFGSRIYECKNEDLRQMYSENEFLGPRMITEEAHHHSSMMYLLFSFRNPHSDFRNRIHGLATPIHETSGHGLTDHWMNQGAISFNDRILGAVRYPSSKS